MECHKVNSSGLIISLFRSDDKDFYCDLYQDKLLMQHVNINLSRQSLITSFNKCMEYNQQVPFNRLSYCIYQHNKRVGISGLIRSKIEPTQAEIGTIVSSNVQSQGIAFDVMKVLINLAFTTLSINRIYANFDCKNTSAIKLVNKLGFCIEPFSQGMCYCYLDK